MAEARPEPDPALVERVARIALALPEAYEEDAWTGVRWCVRKKNFAHLLMTTADRIVDYLGDLEALPTGPTPLLTFRSHGDELLALVNAGYPFLKPPWSPTVMSMVVADTTDWAEVAELVTESYRFLAPQKLTRLLD